MITQKYMKNILHVLLAVTSFYEHLKFGLWGYLQFLKPKNLGFLWPNSTALVTQWLNLLRSWSDWNKLSHVSHLLQLKSERLSAVKYNFIISIIKQHEPHQPHHGVVPTDQTCWQRPSTFRRWHGSHLAKRRGDDDWTSYSFHITRRNTTDLNTLLLQVSPPVSSRTIRSTAEFLNAVWSFTSNFSVTVSNVLNRSGSDNVIFSSSARPHTMKNECGINNRISSTNKLTAHQCSLEHTGYTTTFVSIQWYNSALHPSGVTKSSTSFG